MAQKTEKMEKLTCKWLENVRLRVKESTYVKYRNLINNHILPQLGDTPVNCLTTSVVEEYIMEKLKNGRLNKKAGLSEKTVKDILAILKEICRYGICCNLAIPCHFDLIKIRRNEREIQILDKKTQAVLENHLLCEDSLTGTGILISLYMGLRIGEVCALKRKHVLYRERILQVRTTMQRLQTMDENSEKRTKVIITKPKSSSSSRDIPIPTFIMRRLEALRDLPQESFLLTGSINDFIEPRTLENIFKRCLKNLRVECFNYHVLRHTFATRCIEDGFDVKTLSEILGHANVNITLNRYMHSSMEQKRKNMDRLMLIRNYKRQSVFEI